MNSTTPEQHKILMSFVADLPHENHRCVFNVLRKEHKHRECGHRAWATVNGYEFCMAHAEQVSSALMDKENK